MDILVIGGTRYFGIYLVKELLTQGHNVTIATRGNVKDCYGDKVSRITFERTDADSVKKALSDRFFDVIYDKIAYCSNDVKYVLDVIKCNKYIMMSSTSVYEKHWNTKEDDFKPLEKKLIWCSRMDFPYDEIKRQAECALWQSYKNINAIAVRYPFVIGKDDYTKRLFFYVEHAIKGIPMHIDNIDYQMGFLRSDEAGKFMAFLADKCYLGPINGSSYGTISIREILNYVIERTGKKAVLSEDGERAPYNGEPEYSINTNEAEKLGYKFSDIKDWIYVLIDYYIESVIFK
ncbi:NAD-dependent epimerase/dehydratase family protein [Clostridium chromiireducens]|uniref:UDP-glucose 4-epimerase n=1 Tax=Clostridium chromiireducens TaxID=225345 RepID=A0A399IT36_9CLOT|nr:NAD-dependent epimerase/dehydratase family protein [Clostridium chromiireducens]RII35479.1 NAD-dependent epimerase/dehydratase family protein [Clostridium chromiireducens]